MSTLPTRLLAVAAALSLASGAALAQQDAMFTKYMFNSLSYNPADAGSKDFMSIGLLHRSQWLGIDGAPTTQTLTAHTPLRNERVGVGLAITNDAIGPTDITFANLSYAYRIPVSDRLRLSVGLQGGLESWRADFSELVLEDGTDVAFQGTENRLLPNFGAGLFLFGERFYAGLSSPHILEYDLRDNTDPNVSNPARAYRHYYAALGAAFPLGSEDVMFKPSMLFKNVGLFSGLAKEEALEDIGAPSEVDIDASVLFYQRFWIGTSFRTALNTSRSSFDSVDLWGSVNLDNGLRIGAAYDYPLTELNQVTSATFELMLGYEFNFLNKRIVTPRYF